MTKRADKRKFHYIYRINRTDGSGKYYIGMHSTDDMEDGYFGSGKILWHSIKKHGQDKHEKQILEFLPSRAALKLREKEIVNEEIVADPFCMNLKVGGEGGGGFVSEEHKRKWLRAGGLAGGKAAWHSTPLEERRRRAKKAYVTNLQNGTGAASFWAGKQLSARHKENQSKTMQERGHSKGEKNSQFGTVWVCNIDGPQKISKEQLENYLRQGFNRGRKLRT
jgi:hypothetical protein